MSDPTEPSEPTSDPQNIEDVRQTFIKPEIDAIGVRRDGEAGVGDHDDVAVAERREGVSQFGMQDAIGDHGFGSSIRTLRPYRPARETRTAGDDTG